MPLPLAPHPDFPIGTPVRVKPMAANSAENRRRLEGRIGAVVKSSRSFVHVEFDGELFREHFRPEQLERV
jgi:hypothetical protein